MLNLHGVWGCIWRACGRFGLGSFSILCVAMKIVIVISRNLICHFNFRDCFGPVSKSIIRELFSIVHGAPRQVDPVYVQELSVVAMKISYKT